MVGLASRKDTTVTSFIPDLRLMKNFLVEAFFYGWKTLDGNSR